MVAPLGSTHSREKECDSGSVVQETTNSEDERIKSIVQNIFRIFSTPNIDLFATRENRKLTVFRSPFPHHLAWGCDALDWIGMFAYAFLPPISIPKLLKI